jgi:hypothetical protein
MKPTRIGDRLAPYKVTRVPKVIARQLEFYWLGYRVVFPSPRDVAWIADGV